jgi:hypothetical protein
MFSLRYFLLTLLFAVASLAAQEGTAGETGSPEDRLGVAEDEFVPLSNMRPLESTNDFKNAHSFQYGVTAANTIVTDSKQLKSGYFLGNYRPYFKYAWNETHIFNARGKFAYKNNPSLTDTQAKTGALASTAEYAIELFNAELNFGRHDIAAGRSFFKLGRGLLFANFADGVEYKGAYKYALVKVLGAYSGQYEGCTISVAGCGTAGDIVQKSPYDVVPGRPVDANLPNAGKRFFAGLEAQSPQLFGSSAYVLALYSRDLNREQTAGTTNKGKNYAFDPLYMGLGFSGFVVTPRLRYLTEFIYETGKTYDKNNLQTNINAWGLTADVNYAVPIWEKYLKSGLIFQYATASGRKSSSSSPTNPSQENTSGDDNNFFYFGAYSAGLALKPKISNLHIIRGGFQFRPLHTFYWGRNLLLAFKYSYYLKANANYAISDSSASVAKSTVGQGFDIQTVWDFRSDFKLFYAYGLFLPSEAYTSANSTTLNVHILSLNFFF